jgi:hypothetical protein
MSHVRLTIDLPDFVSQEETEKEFGFGDELANLLRDMGAGIKIEEVD